MTDHVTGTREAWRGTDVFDTVYQLLDRAPKGRDEDDIPSGEWWWRRHDEYEEGQRR